MIDSIKKNARWRIITTLFHSSQIETEDTTLYFEWLNNACGYIDIRGIFIGSGKSFIIKLSREIKEAKITANLKSVNIIDFQFGIYDEENLWNLECGILNKPTGRGKYGDKLMLLLSKRINKWKQLNYSPITALKGKQLEVVLNWANNRIDLSEDEKKFINFSKEISEKFEYRSKQNKKYHAFCLFPQKGDTPLFKYIQNQFTTYSKKAGLSLKMYSNIVFSDSLLKKLKLSKYLILFTSPELVRSEKIIDAIEYWLLYNEIHNIIIVLLKGNISWNENDKDFDWNYTNVLPDIFQNMYNSQPFIFDLRFIKSVKDQNLNKILKLKEQMIKIYSRITLKPPQSIYKTEMNLIKKRSKIIILLAFIASLLTALLCFLLLQNIFS